MFQRLILLILFFISISCKNGQALRFGGQDLFSFGAQESCHFPRNSLGVRISWKDATPITFKIHSSVPTQFDDDILSAANRWNNSYGKKLITVYRDNSVPYPPAKERENGIYWMQEWDPEFVREQARTSTNYDLSRIIDSDIRINAKNFVFALTANTVGTSSVNLESLLMHEFGHALGLQHSNEVDGVMYYTLGAGKVRLDPSEQEKKDLACEY